MGSTKYKIITSYDPVSLEIRVNAAISESYAPHGSLAVTPSGMLIQTMLRL